MEEIKFIAYESFCTIKVEDSIKDMREILMQCRKMAYNVQDTLNMYDCNSELFVLCKNYIPGRACKISGLLESFIRINLEVSRMTGGIFDFTIGRLKKNWNFITDTPEIPSERTISEALNTIGYHNVHLDNNHNVIFDIPDILLDPGASGKGLALDLVTDYLRLNGVKHAMLDFGGQLSVIGGKKTGEPWKIGIRDPLNTSQVYEVKEVMDRSIATSSWYEHYFEKEGRIYSHVLDPVSGKPIISNVKSATVIGESAVWADMLSTVFVLLGKENGVHFMEKISAGKGLDLSWSFC